MSKRVAVMDLGTNTFHLLIAEGDAAGTVTLFQTTEATKLGEGGINKGVIQPAAYARGMAAMRQFHEYILQYNLQEVCAIATSALRSAANGQAFIDKVHAATGIEIKTVNGDEEAGYIYKGVKAGGCLSAQNSLIIDIGGGSVEFIAGNAQEIFWKQSFEIGAARLMDRFHQTGPISTDAIKQLNDYLAEHLKDLFKALAGYPIANLVGSSGAFETFATLVELKKGNTLDLQRIKCYQFEEAEFKAVTDYLIGSSHDERSKNKGIIPVRVDMIVTAALVTRFILQQLHIDHVILSTNALKEGVLAELLENA